MAAKENRLPQSIPPKVDHVCGAGAGRRGKRPNALQEDRPQAQRGKKSAEGLTHLEEWPKKRSRKQPPMFRIAISIGSGAQELIVKGENFDRATEETGGSN